MSVTVVFWRMANTTVRKRTWLRLNFGNAEYDRREGMSVAVTFWRMANTTVRKRT